MSLKVVSNRLPELGKAIRDKSKTQRHKAAEDLAASAKRRAPVKTGQLRESITVEGQGDSTDLVTVGAPYAPFVNNGHHTRGGSWVPPNPFWDAAIEEMRAKYPDYFKDLV